MRRSLTDRVYERLAPSLPAGIAARIDLTRIDVRNSWGGPMNGQKARQAMIRELFAQVRFDCVLETGTFRGTTTEFLAHLSGLPVWTAESNRRYFLYAQRRFAHELSVTVEFSDSREFLERHAEHSGSATALVYLDAHWGPDLPLREELLTLSAGWSRIVVVIDDFMVPNDPGYGHDVYGPGRALDESILPELPGWSRFYPMTPSQEESGARRGCIVLASAALSEIVDTVATLRRA